MSYKENNIKKIKQYEKNKQKRKSVARLTSIPDKIPTNLLPSLADKKLNIALCTYDIWCMCVGGTKKF